MNGILGAGSCGIAMAKHSPYMRNISVAMYIENAGRKCPNEKSRASFCKADSCAVY